MKDSKVWVIGGNRGIGKAITIELAAHGMIVFPTDEDTVDVMYPLQLRDAYSRSTPQCIVYCAGVNKMMPAEQFDDIQALRMLDINLVGFMRVIRLVAETGAAFRPHSVVAISSDAATHPMRNSMAYCASKAGLNAAVKCAARELAPHTSINAIAPGPIANTPMSDDVDEQVARIKGSKTWYGPSEDAKTIPMKRRGFMEEIAQLTYAVLEAPYYMTGAILEVNGGR